MRLTSEEIEAIRSCAKLYFGKNASVRLFGSRVDDAARGGDVDLHIEAESADFAVLSNELEFSSRLKDALGDQRIDIVLRPPRYEAQAIDQIAIQTGISLLRHGEFCCARKRTPGYLRTTSGT